MAKLPATLDISENLSVTPVKVPLFISNPLGFKAVYLLTNYDELARRILLAQHVGLVGRRDMEVWLDEGASVLRSRVRILRCGVDTVRQLYNGKLRPEVMALFDLSVDVVEFAGYEWSKGRIGRDSGYQYRLQNAELGLILLIKNHNIKVDTLGSANWVMRPASLCQVLASAPPANWVMRPASR